MIRLEQRCCQRDSPVLVKEREPGRAGTFREDRAGGSKNCGLEAATRSKQRMASLLPHLKHMEVPELQWDRQGSTRLRVELDDLMATTHINS